MKDLENTHRVATILTQEMKRDRELLLLTIKELINKVDKENIITNINTTTLQNKEIIQVISIPKETNI